MRKQNKKALPIVQGLARPTLIVISFLSFLFVMLLVNIVFKQNFDYLTQTFNYTPELAYQTLNAIDSAGRNAHLLVLIPDLIMVALYSVFLVGANYAVSNRFVKNCVAISILTFMPLILSITQITEIVLLAIILLNFPLQMLPLARFANTVTMMKTLLTILFFLTPVVGLGVWGVKRVTKV